MERWVKKLKSRLLDRAHTQFWFIHYLSSVV